FQAVHRAHARWLETRWNQTDVHSCLDEVHQLLVIIFLVSKSRWKFSGCDRKRNFVSGIAFSENDQADIIPEKAIEKGHKDFKTFFVNNARDHSKNGAARRRREIHFFEERLTANLFSPKLLHIVTRWDQTIRRRIPACVIRAIQNRDKTMGVFAQDAVKAAAARWRENFAPVMLAYGCDPVGIKDSALEEIQPSKELDPMQSEKSLRQIGKHKIKSPKTALICHVMNGQHSLEWRPLRMHKHRHQRCGPIVHV